MLSLSISCKCEILTENRINIILYYVVMQGNKSNQIKNKISQRTGKNWTSFTFPACNHLCCHSVTCKIPVDTCIYCEQIFDAV